MDKKEIIERILQLKKEKNAVILAHYYTNPEIQDICDFLGDSLGLSQEAGKTDAGIIGIGVTIQIADRFNNFGPNSGRQTGI